MTVVQAIKEILKINNDSLTIAQIYEGIVKSDLYAFNAKDPKSIVRQQVRRHCLGLEFPSAMPSKYFQLVGNNKYALYERGHFVENSSSEHGNKDKIPEENIQDFHHRHIEETKRSLLDMMLNIDPSFFEQLILDLLLKMGYGSNGSASHMGGSHDGGIDGEILQDRLGLDRIYTQAKRYHLGKVVEVSEVRDFVGALQNIQKGVFITTSKFSSPARRYAKEQQQKMIVLIDGDQLTQFMIEFELGVQKNHSYSIYSVDHDYFGEV